MKTALVLGGGGSRGSYQLGVWKALRELNIYPDIITGTSVGALNGAMMVQGAFEKAVKIWETLDTTSIFDCPKEPDFFTYTKAFLRQGGICRNGLQALIANHLSEDAIRSSPITFGMMLSRKEDFAPCPVFTEDIPKGALNDYLMATTACFPAAKGHMISGVEYIDGGYCDNLPINLAKSRGANHIIAVCLDTLNTKEQSVAKENFTLIYPRWNLGNWLVFRKENTKRNIRLGYLDALKSFGVYGGDSFTFQKNTFRELSRQKQLSYFRWKRLLQSERLFPENCSAEELLKKSAETVGKLLKISPYRVYTAQSLLTEIRRKLSCPKKRINQSSENQEEKLAKAFLSVFI